VFVGEYNSYCIQHLIENFLKEATKHGIGKEVMGQIVKKSSVNRRML